MILCVNGQFVDEKKAHISPLDNGFLYGDGFYDTMRSYDGKVFELELHMKRIEKSAKVMGIQLTWPLEKIAKWTQEIVQKNHLKNARVRATVTRGVNGFDFLGAKKPTLIIAAEELKLDPKDYRSGVAVLTMKLERILPEIKTIGLTHMIVAYRWAVPQKAYEVILIDRENFVREGASTSVFVVKKGKIYTPKNKILKGSTRRRVIQLAQKMGYKVTTRDFKKGLLRSADEIFLTNRPREIIPVVKLDHRKIASGKPGTVTKKIMAEYQQYVRKYFAAQKG